jgi:hypothetical protein
MPVTLIRMYASREVAENAWKELRRHRFSSSDVHVVHPPAEGADPVPELIEAGVGRHRAERFAERLRQGGSLLVVHPPFGTAEQAEQVLDYFEPVATGVPDRDYDMDGDYSDDATPFSRALGWKVLLRNSPSPFSDTIGWNTLSKTSSPTYPASIPVKQLGGSAAPLSGMVGLPTLTRDAAPMFAGSEVSRLSAKAAPFSGMLMMKTLLSAQTFLVGTKLMDNPAPFSDALRLPVLTKHQR